MTALRKPAASPPLLFLPVWVLLMAALVVTGCAEPQAADSAAQQERARSATAPVPDSLDQATFAGGCFWCTEAAFQKLSGVQSAVSGFSGGTSPNPTYDAVSSGQTDYAEVVQVTYDPDQITYQQLLDAYWRHMDPTDAGGQFADRGSQYRPVIFYHNARQQRLARRSKQELAESGPFSEPIVVKIQPFERFYEAEAYHQDYFKTHPERYKEYYEASGRGPFVRKVWGDKGERASTGRDGASTEHASVMQTASTTSGPASSNGAEGPSAITQQMTTAQAPPPWKEFEKPSKAQLRKQLTDMQYYVTQKNGTEPAFENKYYDNKRAGIYVDVVSGEPLFSSKTKFDSGTGWPSFYKPLEPKYIVKKEDRSAGMVRTEVRSKLADSHLGHVFKWSGSPEVPTGLRYCLNSAALRFIPADELEAQGYGMYTDLFE